MARLSRRDRLFIGTAAASGLVSLGGASASKRERIRLSLNENPFGPSPRALQAIKGHLQGLSRYTDNDLADLVHTIAIRENVGTEHIVLGEILEVIGRHLSTGAGGEFIYSEPGYTALVDAVSPSSRVIGVPLNDRLENDLPAIVDKVGGNTRAVYLVNPHNPTGIVGDVASLIEAVRELSKRTLVVVDEAYLEFTPDFEQRTLATLVRDGANVAVIRTFSKIYGLAGLAIGYTLAPSALVSSLVGLGVDALFNLNLLSVVAANASLRDSGYVESVRAKVAAEREAWHDLFRREGVRHTQSCGNFVFFDARRPHSEVAAALEAEGIEIGRGYPRLNTWVRISVGLPAENEAARRAVAKLLRQS